MPELSTLGPVIKPAYTAEPKAFTDPLHDAMRMPLSADLTLYVRSDGSDSNTGLTNDAAGAFLTVQAAVNRVSRKYEFCGYFVMIQVADGTFNGAIEVFGNDLTGRLILNGNPTTPANVTLNYTGDVISVYDNGHLTIAGFKLISSFGNCIRVFNEAFCVVGAMEYPQIGGIHLFADGGSISLNGGYTISGGADCHLKAVEGGNIYEKNANPVTLTGTPTFDDAFAAADNISFLHILSSYTGAAIGKRYSASGGSVIHTSNRLETFFPGSIEGTVGSFSAYLGAKEHPIECWPIAIGDEISPCTVGVAKVTFFMPNYETKLLAVETSVTIAPTGSPLVMNLKEAGATVFSTKPSISAGQEINTTGTLAVISDPSLAARAKMTVDIDAVGSTIAGQGPKMYLYFRRVDP